MSKTIWKYPLSQMDVIDIPVGAEILLVDEQDQRVCMWVCVDPEAEKMSRTFVTYGTGFDFDDTNHKYIGTAKLASGKLILHVFEVFNWIE